MGKLNIALFISLLLLCPLQSFSGKIFIQRNASHLLQRVLSFEQKVLQCPLIIMSRQTLAPRMCCKGKLRKKFLCKTGSRKCLSILPRKDIKMDNLSYEQCLCKCWHGSASVDHQPSTAVGCSYDPVKKPSASLISAAVTPQTKPVGQ